MSAPSPYNPDYRPSAPLPPPPPEAAPEAAFATASTYVPDCCTNDRTIPLATEVIIIPNEPVREDTERFWNYDDAENPAAKPKNGIGCMNGWTQEISIFYTIYWLVTVVVVTIALIGIAGVFGPGEQCPYSDWYCDPTWIWKLQRYGAVPLYLIFVFARVVCCCGACADHTYQYLRNMKDTNAAKQLLESYFSTTPEFYIDVACSHTETRGSGDDKRTVTVTTYTAKERVTNIRSCVDITEGKDNINLNEYRMTKIKLTKSFVPDQQFLDKKKELYEANKHRDTTCSVTERMDIRSFQPYLLAYVNDDQHERSWAMKKNLLSPSIYALSQLLLYPALPYRIWMCSITGKIKMDVRKKLELY